MTTVFTIVLIAHIVSGITCFGTGIMAILSKKGGKLHRISGKVYFIGMLGVIFSAFFLAYIRTNNFLLFIASFSFYMVWAGYRSVKNKALTPSTLDWIVWAIGVLTAVGMLLSNNVILLAFGGLHLFNLIRELRLFPRHIKGDKTKPNAWLLRHIGMMIGSYIATFTAFLVVNVQTFEPAWIPWLAPTIFGIPLITFLSRKYKTSK